MFQALWHISQSNPIAGTAKRHHAAEYVMQIWPITFIGIAE
jgi:hypothetical protein